MRGRRARLSDDARAEFALKYHVDAIQMGKGNKGINQVHHVMFGWMQMQDYYRLAKLHDIPWDKIIEGGYRVKAALWNLSISVAGFEIPVGMVFPTVETVGLASAIASQSWADAAFWAYALLGPFGDVLAIIGIIRAVAGLDEKIAAVAQDSRQNSIIPPIILPVPI